MPYYACTSYFASSGILSHPISLYAMEFNFHIAQRDLHAQNCNLEQIVLSLIRKHIGVREIATGEQTRTVNYV